MQPLTFRLQLKSFLCDITKEANRARAKIVQSNSYSSVRDVNLLALSGLNLARATQALTFTLPRRALFTSH